MGELLKFRRTPNSALESTVEEAKLAIQAIIMLQQYSSSLFSLELPMPILSRLEWDMRNLLKSLHELQ